MLNRSPVRPIRIGLLGFLLAMCASSPLAAASNIQSGLAASRLLNHVQVLASDEFEGRAPGTVGETKTVDYLIEQFKGLGLER